MKFPAFVGLVSVALALTIPADLSAQEARRHINPRSSTDPAALPFSGAVLVGNTLYLSGTIGLDEDQQVELGHAQSEGLVQLGEVLGEEQMGPGNVVKDLLVLVDLLQIETHLLEHGHADSSLFGS